jgi:DnaJ-class molecular chaperone
VRTIDCATCEGRGHFMTPCQKCVGQGSFEERWTCPICNGTGLDDYGHGQGVCPNCAGEPYKTLPQDCEKCRGAGEVSVQCGSCDGRGQLTIDEDDRPEPE